MRNSEKSTVSRPHRRWYRRRWAMMIWIGAAAVIVALLTISLVPVSAVTGGAMELQLQSGSIEAENQLNQSAMVSSSPTQHLMLSRIAIINASDHPLMHRLTPKIAEHLQTLPLVEHVTTQSADDQPIPGQPLADMYIVLDMPQFESSGVILTGRKITAAITAGIGRHGWESSHRVNDSTSPPLIDASCNMTLHHTSTTTGYESADARYQLAIDNIATQLNDAFAKQLSQWAADYGTIAAMPADLYPAYQPTPPQITALLPADTTWQLQYSGHGLMAANETCWTGVMTDPRKQLLPWIDQLKAAGWEIYSQTLDTHASFVAVRAIHDSQVLEAYSTPNRIDVANKPTTAMPMAVVYHQPIASSGITDAIDKLLDDQASLNTLAMLRSNMHTAQRDAFYQRLEQTPSLEPALQVMLLQHLHDDDRDEQVMQRLPLAYLIAQAAQDTPNVEALKKLAVEITGDQDWRPAGVTRQDLQKAGFTAVQLKSPAVVEVGLDQPAWFFLDDSDDPQLADDPMLAGVTVSPSQIPEGKYTLTLRVSGYTGRSSSSRTMHDPPSPWRDMNASGMSSYNWLTAGREIGSGRFEITLTVNKEHN